jgi:pyruvate formate lyase activating enzyme
MFTQLDVPGKATLELLTYHEYGKDKYASLGMEYTMTATAKVTKEQVQSYIEILEAAGMKVIRT